VDHDLVAGLYRDGVNAIVASTADFDAQSWARPTCGRWDGADTVRHVLAVARWYDIWLDRALAGDTSRPFAASAIDERNDREIETLRHLDGPAAIVGFERVANAYLQRAVAYWDTPFGYPFGTVSVGLHLGVAATEWHLHAHDLARSANRSHSPSNPEALFLAAGACVAEPKPALQRSILRRLVPLGARRHPWATILRQSGRKFDGSY
jgi:Mycothiol maleylpyruvate isomerase N-terminal domain